MLVRRVFLGVIVFNLALVAGCSDSLGGRMGVTGRVNLKGEPLNDGSIYFVPLDGQDTQSGAPIVNGQYQVPQKNGLKPGKYLVRLTAGDGRTIANEAIDDPHPLPGPGGKRNIVSMDRIPAEWNVKSNKEVIVKSDGGNQFDFDIPNVNTPRKR